MKSDQPEAPESRARLWENTLQDIRYGLRVLQKNRGFSLAALSRARLELPVQSWRRRLGTGQR